MCSSALDAIFWSLFFELLPSVEVRPWSAKVLTKEGSMAVNDVESDFVLSKSKVRRDGIIRSCWSSDASILTNQFKISKNGSKINTINKSNKRRQTRTVKRLPMRVTTSKGHVNRTWEVPSNSKMTRKNRSLSMKEPWINELSERINLMAIQLMLPCCPSKPSRTLQIITKCRHLRGAC